MTDAKIYAITLQNSENIMLAKSTLEVTKSLDGRPAITLQNPLMLVQTEKGFAFAPYSICADTAVIYTANLAFDPQIARSEFASAYQKATSNLILPDTNLATPQHKLVV